MIDAALVERAQSHYEALATEYGVAETVAPAFDASRAGMDPTLIVRAGLLRALERAARATAAALRSGKI